MSPKPKTRQTEAVIDLDALAFNFHSSRNFIGPDVKYLAVVKADAYGHGAVECALRLEAEGVDWFGVAIPEEGVELRQAGVRSPILCLGSFWPGQEELVVQNQLTPVIYDERAAASLNKFCSENDRTIDIHVKIDTGMGRVGIDRADARSFAEMLTRLDQLKVTGLLTHFASAENPAENDFTKTQIERFDEACEAFHKAGHSPALMDLANSPGAITHPNGRGNLVRLGGALYGLLGDILPAVTVQPALKPILSLRSRVAHVRRVATGETLGYGRTFATNRDSLIALVPIGYDDGYPRGLSNVGRACVREHSVPVVGRISMDWTLLDVTDVPNISVDDEVFLIGGDARCSVTAAEIAGEIGTIGYEITCGISQRVPRIYLGSQG